MELSVLAQRVQESITLIGLEETEAQAAALEVQMQQPDFWNNQEEAARISQQLNELKTEAEQWRSLEQEIQDTAELLELAEQEQDKSVQQEAQQKKEELVQRFEQLEFTVLLSAPYDAEDVILSIHAGAGGDDAQDWAEMLFRMISRFAEQQEWSVDILDVSRGGTAGVKSATLQIRGRYAYGYLKSEHGAHRLVRISPFDAEGMRHTSFANMEVIPDFGTSADIEIDQSEIRIDVFRAGGKGGQGVNTTDSAVRIVHQPTGITVTCQNERSQHQNKATAMAILKSKLYARQLEEQEQERLALRGEHKSAEWGNQIRSYVLHPYKMVKDHRTTHESAHPDKVLDGDLKPFMEAYLRWQQAQ